MTNDEMRLEALRLASGFGVEATEDIVARANLFFEFLSGDWKKPEADGDQSE